MKTNLSTSARYYVGLVKGSHCARKAFQASKTPTPESTPEFSAVIGPFRTRRGAQFCASNPFSPCQTVAEHERAAKAEANKLYDVFVRDWWREAGRGEAGWPNGLVPYPGAPKETLAEGVTYAEARELCEEYNSTHEPGRYSRKAEFMEA